MYVLVFCMSLGKMSIQVLCPFKVRLSFCYWVVWVPYGNIFWIVIPLCEYIVCLVILLIAILLCRRLFNPIQIHLLIFASVACAFTGLVSYPKKSLPSPMWKNEERNSVMGQTFQSSLKLKGLKDRNHHVSFQSLFSFHWIGRREGEERKERGRENIQYLHLFCI